MTGGGPPPDRGARLWAPSSGAVGRSRLTAFAMHAVGDRIGPGDYTALHEWSLDHPDELWRAVDEFFGLGIDPRRRYPVRSSASVMGCRWFEGATVNYAEAALAGEGDAPAIIAHSQARATTTMSWDELRRAVAAARRGLAGLGVGRGDAVAAYLPNIPEAVVAFLATASLGATWASCPPEFGVSAVVDRFRQVGPKVLLVVDGYRFGERSISRHGEVDAMVEALTGVRHVVHVGLVGDPADSTTDGPTWDDLVAEPGPLEFEPVPFDHPLYVLFSSGTTGIPKGIVHGHGGILLEHAKALGLHLDLGGDDRLFWFTTTGWMMWNFLVSGLVVGSSIVLFDGDPTHPDLTSLWKLAADEGVTVFGVSAPFLTACAKQDLRPGELGLDELRIVGSTGAPLPGSTARWVYDAVGQDLMLSSISGGTDVCSAFVGGCPWSEVRAGEIPARFLGVDAAAFDAHGNEVVGEVGELVVRKPLPSMPVGFVADPDGARYRKAYFEHFPGVWRHGDWVVFEADGSCRITGRSDATLNRGGVRLGTAELYAVVDAFPEISDSLAVHLEDDDGGAGSLILLVAPAEPSSPRGDLVDRLRDTIRRALSPRHVPDEVLFVEALPRTLSGKRLEVPVKRLLRGEPVHAVADRDVVDRPDALDELAALASTRIGPPEG